jgi:PAS domain S-box-containing protein
MPLRLHPAPSPLGPPPSAAADLLDHISELVCVTGPDGRITYVNAAWRRAFGYTLDEAAAIPPAAFVVEEDRGRYRDVAHRLVAGAPIVDFEAVLLAKDGRRVVCRGRATPCYDNGAFIGTRAVYRDVTEERRGEAIRTRLAATLEATSDFVGITTKEGRVVYLNRAGRLLVGLAEDADPAQLTITDLHPERELQRITSEALPAARWRGTWEGESVLLGAGGEEIPVSLVLVAHPSTRPGEPPYFISAVMRDLRERVRAEAALRASEARFRAASDGSLDSFYLLRTVRGGDGQVADFEVVDCNPRGALLVRMPREDLIGHRVGELFPLVRAAMPALARAADSGETLEAEFETPDPRLTAGWVRVQVVPLSDGLALTARDVTGRKQLEVARAEAERLKDQLIGTASHELRTPLTAVRGALDHLAGSTELARALGATQQTLFEMARRNVARLVRLVDQLLDIERLESGAHALDLRAVPAAVLLEGARDLMQATAQRPGVRLAVEQSDLVVRADAERITQVLVNLVTNAIKFSPRGSTVTLGATPDEAGVRFCVCDQGCGIPADRLEAIFERFAQVRASDARDRGGAGLGLAIARAIVRQHGGRIWAESVLGKGSLFSFVVPAA